MARLTDFSLDDSSPATSPHANDQDTGSQDTEKASVPEARAAPGADLPDPKAKPAKQLVVCERAIHEAKARWHQTAEQAMARFLDEAGPHLVWIHEHKLYKHLKDATGKPYKSFSRYCQEQHGISRASGYRITRVVPLLTVLAGATPPVTELSARQVQVLHPLRRQHGDQAVLDVWSTASETKKRATPTPEELTKALTLCGFAVRPDEDDDRADPAEKDPRAEVARAAKILAPETVRTAVQHEPEKVIMLVKTLAAALEEAGVSVE